MKHLILFVFGSYGFLSYGQLSLEQAREAALNYELGYYSYHQPFEGHAGYGAPIILTADGGAAFFGSSGSDEGDTQGLLVKLNEKGKEEWTHTVTAQFNEIEVQSVVQDRAGNYYVFLLSYNYDKYRGGSERVARIDQSGHVIWDKMIGDHELMNNPIFSYIRALDDGRINLRGHIVIDKPAEGKDPVYRTWEGWLNSDGELTQKTGDVIDWSNPSWQEWLKPE